MKIVEKTTKIEEILYTFSVLLLVLEIDLDL